MYSRLCKIAGFTKGNFTKQSGRASSCTRMFGKKKDEQLIASVSDHCSTAIHNYKHISDELCKDLSDAIQGNSVKNDENVYVNLYQIQLPLKSNVSQIRMAMCFNLKQKN